MSTSARKIIPIYTTRGDPEAFLFYPYIVNRVGEWIGWVTPKREVYSVLGYFVGHLTDEPRILRKRATDTLHPRLEPPPPPGKLYPPATIPLAPLMRELTHAQIDVLMEESDRLHPLDIGEFRQDLD